MIVITGPGRSGTTVLHHVIKGVVEIYGKTTVCQETRTTGWNKLWNPSYVPGDRHIRRHPYLMSQLPIDYPRELMDDKEAVTDVDEIDWLFLCLRNLDDCARSWAARGASTAMMAKGAKRFDFGTNRNAIARGIGEFMCWATEWEVPLTVIPFDKRLESWWLLDQLDPVWGHYGIKPDIADLRAVCLRIEKGPRVS